MLSLQDGNKLYVKKRLNINVSKLFTHDFFNYLGIQGVHIHKISESLESEIVIGASLPMPHSLDNTILESTIVNDVESTVNNDVFLLPDPSEPHENEAITLKDFELSPMKTGGGIVSNISQFFSRFLNRGSTNIKNSLLSTNYDDATNTDILIEFDPQYIKDEMKNLSEMEKKKQKKTICTLDILGGISYVELEYLSKSLDKQIEYMAFMNVEMNMWRKDSIYRIGNHFVNFDVEDIEDFTEKKYGKKKKTDFMRELIGVESIKIRGTRLTY
jgi:hypothetical protein